MQFKVHVILILACLLAASCNTSINAPQPTPSESPTSTPQPTETLASTATFTPEPTATITETPLPSFNIPLISATDKDLGEYAGQPDYRDPSKWPKLTPDKVSDMITSLHRTLQPFPANVEQPNWVADGITIIPYGKFTTNSIGIQTSAYAWLLLPEGEFPMVFTQISSKSEPGGFIVLATVFWQPVEFIQQGFGNSFLHKSSFAGPLHGISQQDIEKGDSSLYIAARALINAGLYDKTICDNILNQITETDIVSGDLEKWVFISKNSPINNLQGKP